jgi:hypothetical protein
MVVTTPLITVAAVTIVCGIPIAYIALMYSARSKLKRDPLRRATTPHRSSSWAHKVKDDQSVVRPVG